MQLRYADWYYTTDPVLVIINCFPWYVYIIEYVCVCFTFRWVIMTHEYTQETH